MPVLNGETEDKSSRRSKLNRISNQNLVSKQKGKGQKDIWC